MVGTADDPVIPTPAPRPNPLFWVSRFVLMRTAAEHPYLRDISLQRGLNIVYVEETVERDSPSQIEIGHGVGKTSFCRLIRYCLDEATYGRKAFRTRVVNRLPEARVGLELHVNGIKWAVCRSLSNPNDSCAASNQSIEELLAAQAVPTSYQCFRQALFEVGDATVPPVESDPTDHPERRWSQLLAWCTRDQEARYQTLHDWRSRRSESSTPAFDRPKADAVRFIARVLGLQTATEIGLRNELDGVAHDLGEAERRVREIQSGYETEIARLRRDLATQGVVEADTAPFVALDLYTTPLLDRVQARAQAIDGELTTLNQRLEELGRQIAVLGASINEARQVVDERETVIRITQAGTGALEADVQALQGDLEQLRRIAPSLCIYGQVTFGECDYVRRRIADAEQAEAESRSATARDTAQRDQAVEAQREIVRRVSARVAEFERQQQASLAEQANVARQIGERRFARARLDSTWAECQTWDRRRNGDEADEAADAARSEQTRLRQRRTELQTAIAAERTTVADRLRRLSQLFGSVVRHVLSDDYTGRVVFDGDELDFSIAHGLLVAGEAVDTLCVLLADLTALAAGANALGQHPSWVLHDSPREADLGIVIYRRLLQAVADWSTGDGNAPFQYIVTTTTVPPEQLRWDYGRLSLHNRDQSGLLFGCDLGREATLI